MKLILPEGAHDIISTKDESVRMFESNFLDKFSRVSWYVPLVIFLPAIVFFFYDSIVNVGLGTQKTIILFFAGLLTWTAIEYLFHRFIFHYEPSGLIGRKMHFMIHGVHHAYPNDSLRLVMPPILSLPLSTSFYFIFLFAFGLNSSALFAGFIMGYLAYDMMHYATHHAHFMKADWFIKIKQHHMRHHFQDPDNGFGVSSALWDKIFKTEFKQSS